ncbi:hypothetical protein, partial [Vibrio diabolicus]|uniref:hypothetical protein n=2 Tax=Vibrio diabolicus TaxID=50719 RepID=UPI00198034AF
HPLTGRYIFIYRVIYLIGVYKMAKMVNVTKAGGTMFDDGDKEVLINADNINQIVPAGEDEVGASKIKFNDNTHINVTESYDELKSIIND